VTEVTPASDPMVGRTIRAYEIQEQIGISRWGKVYRAIQKSTNRIVAVRILSPELATLPGKTDHFLEESRRDASLVHPHLVAVYEAGQADGIYFCAMELMDGPPLPQFLRKEGGVDEHRLLLTIAGVARALDFLWQRKIPHQPLQEKNVLTNADGVVKLINVVAVELEPSQSPREDVLQLAVVIATLANDIAPVSKPISEFVENMIGKEGREPFASPIEVADAAEALERKLFPPVKVARSTVSQIQQKRVNPMIFAVVGLVALVLAMVVAWYWWHSLSNLKRLP
jgi:serine/threonine protein kinase